MRLTLEYTLNDHFFGTIHRVNRPASPAAVLGVLTCLDSQGGYEYKITRKGTEYTREQLREMVASQQGDVT